MATAFYITMMVILNLASNGVIVPVPSLTPEEALTKHSPEAISKKIKSCDVSLYNAKDQIFDPDQKILYTSAGKVERYTELNHPQAISSCYFYDSNRCTTYAYVIGKDTILKEDNSYNADNRIVSKQITSHTEKSFEPTVLTQVYYYDNNMLIGVKTLTPKQKIVTRTSYSYSGNEHIATQSYDKYNKLTTDVHFRCDSVTIKQQAPFYQDKYNVCKTITQNDSITFIKKSYHYYNTKSNYTSEVAFRSSDSLILSLTVNEHKKQSRITNTYNERKNLVESLITVDGKQEGKKVYTYDNNNLLIKSEEYGPNNQLYSRYKFEYSYY